MMIPPERWPGLRECLPDGVHRMGVADLIHDAVASITAGRPDAGHLTRQVLASGLAVGDPTSMLIDHASHPMELSVFDEVADALSGLVPRELGLLRYRARRFGIKVWFDDEMPSREHYEAQVIARDFMAEASLAALEVGFHAEHPRETDNAAVIAHLAATEAQWRPDVGSEAVIGVFLGRSDWRRVSETWADPDLEAADLAFEIAARLTDYITAIEPLRRTR